MFTLLRPSQPCGMSSAFIHQCEVKGIPLSLAMPPASEQETNVKIYNAIMLWCMHLVDAQE